jgi:glycosyltransferase involved in cell wall biosynthesis
MPGKQTDLQPGPVAAAPTQISIIIRAYNEEEQIGRLLSGILQQSIAEFEIILVDSGSTDATVAIASRYPVKIVHISPEEFTFGRSLNLGISHAGGEILVFVSAHVYPVYTNWLALLVAPFDDPRVALTYGKQRGNAESKFSENQFFAKWYPDQSTHNQPHPFCNNANAAVRRTLWEQKPYDENLTGLEDLAWAKWAQDQNYQIAYVAEAEIIHVHRETPKKVYNRYRREAMAFKQIFPEETFTLGNFLRLWTTNTVSDLWHATRQKVLTANFRTILWFRLMQFWGTYQGYRSPGPVTHQLRNIFYYPPSLRTDSKPPSGQGELIRYSDGAET